MQNIFCDCGPIKAAGLGRIHFNMALDVEHLQTSQTQRPGKVVRFTARAGLLPKLPVKASTAESTRAFIEALFDAILTPEVRAAAEAFVSGLLKDPERIREGLEALIEEERAEGCWGTSTGSLRCGLRSSPK